MRQVAAAAGAAIAFVSGMRPRWRKGLAILPYLLLLAAVFYLYRELRGLSWNALWTEIKGRPVERIAFAFGLLLLNYGCYVAYDLIALRQMGRRAPLGAVARAASLSFSLTNLVGHAMVTGMALRYREYARHGLSLANVTGIVVQYVEAWWAGFLLLLAAILSGLPEEYLRPVLDPAYARPSGALLFALVAAYLIICFYLSGRKLRLGAWRVHLPDLPGGGAKIAVAVSDILLTAATLRVLMPAHLELPLPVFFAYYLLAHATGVISAVPGGLGVMESMVLKLFRPYAADEAILASLVLYRLIHYALPALITVGVETARPLRRRRREAPA